MDKKEKMITLPCDCKCCMFVVEKTQWTDGELSYNISIQDSRYDHNYNTIWGRLKRACKALFGKPVYFSDVHLEGEAQYKKLVADMTNLLNSNLDACDSNIAEAVNYRKSDGEFISAEQSLANMRETLEQR